MRGAPHLHPDFRPEPLWWDEYRPAEGPLEPVPRTARVAIVGAGYAGLSAALELHRHGVEAVVLEALDAGSGASTRSAGFICSHGNLAPRYAGAAAGGIEAERRRHAEALATVDLVERVIAEEKIDCGYTECGHVTLAWTPEHREALARKARHLNAMGAWGARLLSEDEARAEVASDFYFGGLLIARSGLMQPALYYRGLLDACRARGIAVCTRAPVTGIARKGAGWTVTTGRGACEAGNVIVATNGYTGEATPRFRRRIFPIGSYVMASEELPADAVRAIIPKGRSVYDSRRVISYCRPSPDGRRFLFGGRVRFGLTDPAETVLPLYRLMLERFPQLAGCRITHAWTGNLGFTFDEMPHAGEMDGLHYALGCNGTGIAMMTYLGTRIGQRVAVGAGATSIFEESPLPANPLYHGRPWFVPLVGAYFNLRDRLDRALATRGRRAGAARPASNPTSEAPRSG